MLDHNTVGYWNIVQTFISPYCSFMENLCSSRRPQSADSWFIYMDEYMILYYERGSISKGHACWLVFEWCIRALWSFLRCVLYKIIRHINPLLHCTNANYFRPSAIKQAGNLNKPVPVRGGCISGFCPEKRRVGVAQQGLLL